jgi:AcrR family transcriptional regulator
MQGSSAPGDNDPRIERTRVLLWSTLVALIDEVGYPAISVSDIARRARVNRSTFYHHFEDKDDLFRQGCSDLYDSIFSKLERHRDASSASNALWSPEYFYHLFALVDAERETFRIIGGPKSNPDFRNIMKDKIDTFVIRERFWPFLPGEEVDSDIAVLNATVVSSILSGLIARWFMAPERFSLEKVCDAYIAAITKGVRPYSIVE